MMRAVLRVYPMLCVCGVQRCYILYGCVVTGRCVVLYCSYLLGHAGSHKDTIHTPYSDQLIALGRTVYPDDAKL